MIRKRLSRTAAALSIGAVAALTMAAPSIGAETGVGLTTATPSTLTVFNTGNPGAANTVPITFPGPATDTNLVGIDYRPRGGLLYGLGSGGSLFSMVPVVTMGSITGFTATQVNPTPGVSPLMGTDFGFGFNPAADAIRLVSDSEQSLRLSPNSGAVAGTDMPLDYPAGDPNDAVNPNVVAADYTRSFDGTTMTTLYDIDSGLDILARQGGIDFVAGGPVNDNPNTGLLNTVGPLAVDTTGIAGLDLAQASGIAYASLQPVADTTSSLYRIDLGSGSATSAGQFPAATLLESVAIVPASRLALDGSSSAVAENGGAATITVVRQGPASRAASVSYATSNGTATAGSDYTMVSGMLTFAPNEFAKTFTVPVSDDQATEGSESLNVTLSSPGDNAILVSPSSATLTISDDESGAPGAPVGLVSVGALKAKKLARNGQVPLSFSCDKACEAAFTLKLGNRTLGTAAGSIARSGLGTAIVVVGKSQRKALKRKARRGSVRLKLDATFTGKDGGNSAISTPFSAG